MRSWNAILGQLGSKSGTFLNEFKNRWGTKSLMTFNLKGSPVHFFQSPEESHFHTWRKLRRSTEKWLHQGSRRTGVSSGQRSWSNNQTESFGPTWICGRVQGERRNIWKIHKTSGLHNEMFSQVNLTASLEKIRGATAKHGDGSMMVWAWAKERMEPGIQFIFLTWKFRNVRKSFKEQFCSLILIWKNPARHRLDVES